MYAAERQGFLVRRARAEGRVDVTSSAEDLQVTPETIRRDLSRGGEAAGHANARLAQLADHLAEGGVLAADRLDVEPEMAQRDAVFTAEKDRIAKLALEQLDGQRTLLLDGGTTTARFAQLLPVDRELTVVTNSLPVASLLASRANTTVQLLGGRVRGTTLAAVDSWALQALAGITVDLAFLGANGFSAERGFTTPDVAEGAVKAAMVAAARRTVVLADAGKHGADALVRFATASEVDVLVTDTGLDPRAARTLQAAGPEVVLA